MKILKSLVVIVGVAAIAAVGTWAFFTDQATSEGNVLGASENGIDIVLGGTGSESHSYFNVNDMIPGDTVESCLVVYNPSYSRDVLFRAYAEHTGGSKDLKSKLKVKATLNPLSGCSYDSNYALYGPSDSVVMDRYLSDFIGPANAIHNLRAAYDYSEPLNPGFAAVYKIEVTLDEDADNYYKGGSFVGNLVIDALQAENITEEEARSEWGM